MAEHNYKEIAKQARLAVLSMVYKAQSSHIGSNFSVIDILTVLFEKADITKDKIILSAGWKAASFYYFPADVLKQHKCCYGSCRRILPSGSIFKSLLSIVFKFWVKRGFSRFCGQSLCDDHAKSLNFFNDFDIGGLCEYHKIEKENIESKQLLEQKSPAADDKTEQMHTRHCVCILQYSSRQLVITHISMRFSPRTRRTRVMCTIKRQPWWRTCKNNN